MGLKLYRISQTKNNEYDTFDSAVVVAENEEAARHIHPAQYAKWDWEYSVWRWVGKDEEAGEYLAECSWCSPDDVKAEYLGIPDEQFKPGDVVCASFNAG